MTIAITILVAVIILVIYHQTAESKKIAALQKRYQEALNGQDKRAALDAGRAYYNALRKNKMLTVYDEQAIANDLSAMK